jgi:hypothetical protein
MRFKLVYNDGTAEEKTFSEIDVPEVNRKRPEEIWYGPYGVSRSGEFFFGEMAVPFAFTDESTELIFFKRVQSIVNMAIGRVQEKVAVIVFGLRSTIETEAGPRNHIQLVWVYPDGTVKIGGNK